MRRTWYANTHVLAHQHRHKDSHLNKMFLASPRDIGTFLFIPVHAIQFVCMYWVICFSLRVRCKQLHIPDCKNSHKTLTLIKRIPDVVSFQFLSSSATFKFYQSAPSNVYNKRCRHLCTNNAIPFVVKTRAFPWLREFFRIHPRILESVSRN